jgi:hypothetical protein
LLTELPLPRKKRGKKQPFMTKVILNTKQKLDYVYIFKRIHQTTRKTEKYLFRKLKTSESMICICTGGPIHSCMVAVSCIGLLLSSTVHTDAAIKWFRGLVN